MNIHRHAALKTFNLGEDSLHGPEHWDQVWHNCQVLAEVTPGVDIEVCFLFSMYHDMLRVDENRDKHHGVRAMKRLMTTPLDLTHYQKAQLLTAIGMHSDGMTSTDPTIGVCWDADRMDLPRVGVIPEARYMSTEAGRLMCV